jgi:anti-sigma-K factor RskA
MTRSARPDNWQDLLAGYTLGNLSSEEVEALQQLLIEHPELTAEVDRLQEVLALIPYNVPEQEPPVHLKDSILAAAQADQGIPQLFEAPLASQPEPSAPQSSQTPRRNLARWLVVGSAVAAVALLALGIENYRLRQAAQTNQAIIATLQQPNAALYALEGTENAVQASGSIVVAQNQQVLVVAQNLPSLPQGQTYRLWALSANSQQPAYCGQFNTDEAGTISTLWSPSEARCSTAPTQLLITAELESDPPVPKGELVMKSQG